MDHLLSSLHPSVESPKAAAQVPVPARPAVEIHRAKVQEWERRTRDLETQSAQAERELERTRESRERLAGDKPAITIEALREARNDRDKLWRLVKKRHIEQAPVSSEEVGRHADVLDDLASAFESAVAFADERADRRFANAEAAARLTELALKIREQEADLKRLGKQQEALALEGECLDGDWEALWQASGIRPRDPEAMLEWLRTHGELLDAMAPLAENAVVAESEENEERLTKEKLLKELALDRRGLRQIGGSIPDGGSGARRRPCLGDYQEQKREQSQLRESLRQARAKLGRQGRELEGAKDEWCRWRQQWSASLQALGLDAETNPDAVEVQLDLIDQMREMAGSIEDLRHERIGKISDEIAAYEQAVAKTLGELADDLTGVAPDGAVLELEKRLNEAQSIRQRKADKARDIEGIESDLREQNDKKEQCASIRCVSQRNGGRWHQR